MPLNNFKGRFSQGSVPVSTDQDLNCTSQNIVYLITCKICSYQYVGETARSFAVRMREHWDKVRKGDKSQLVYAHFQSDDRHRNSRIEDMMRFQIIEKIRADDLGQDDALVRKRRLERELYWIAKLRTAFPLGLNDRIQGLGIAGNVTDRSFKDFNYFRIANLLDEKKSKRRGRRLRKEKGKIDSRDFRNFCDDLKNLHKLEVKRLESLILGKKRAYLEKFVVSQEFQTLNSEIRHIIQNRVDFTRRTRPVRKDIEEVSWKIKFSHKIIADVNLNSIINTREIRGALPNELQKRGKFRQVYSYGRTTGSKILNYNRALREAGDLSYDDMTNMGCDCDSSEFRDQHHGHVVSGDLRLIENSKLRQLCSFGAKFREVPLLNKETVKNEFRANTEELIKKLVKKFKIPRAKFKKWNEKVLAQFNSRIDYLARNKHWKPPILSDKACKDELNRLQSSYVITVVDKAAGNFAFTCKKFYFLRLAQELGLHNDQPGNNTYEYQIRTEQEICADLVNKLDKYGALPDDSDKKVALLYHTPKFHKNPIKFRFIAGNVKIVTSRLDATVAKILKMCKGHFVSLCKKYESLSGIRYCFDIERSGELRDGLDRFLGDARSISINDFSTLYTEFEHDHLIRNMTWLLDRLGKNSGCSSVKVSHEKAYWTRDSNSDNSFSIAEIIEMIQLLIGESYIKAFGKNFRQIKGVIMGGKCSGWLSDGSLMVDEFRYIDRIVKNGDLELARRFKGLNRYRDDCTALNLDDFIILAQNIYPPSLELSQENQDLTQAAVLDMFVSVKEGYFRTKVYNKTDDFPFHVVSLPFLESNISTKVCYKVFFSQVLRYQRLCSFKKDFEDRVYSLGKNLEERGYSMTKLGKEFRQVVGKYKLEFEKWEIPINSLSWFKYIFTNPLNRLSPTRSASITPFSQPTTTNTVARFLTFSQ